MSYHRYAALVEYDGSAYSGWQRQPFLSTTIQGQVELALGQIANESVEIVCAGRTDAGVHALGQIIHFDTHAQRSDYAWLAGANRYLPPDIRLQQIVAVREDFHARYDAYRRHYRYIVLNSPYASALWRMRAYWHCYPLEAALMQAAGQQLLGEHDFSAFRAAECQSASPNRFLHRLDVRQCGNYLLIDIVGNAFLHHMVRNIVGSLLMVGDGRRSKQWLADVLAGKDRRQAGPTAPAYGLYFYRVDYPAEDRIPQPAPLLFPC